MKTKPTDLSTSPSLWVQNLGAAWLHEDDIQGSHEVVVKMLAGATVNWKATGAEAHQDGPLLWNIGRRPQFLTVWTSPWDSLQSILTTW